MFFLISGIIGIITSIHCFKKKDPGYQELIPPEIWGFWYIMALYRKVEAGLLCANIILKFPNRSSKLPHVLVSAQNYSLKQKLCVWAFFQLVPYQANFSGCRWFVRHEPCPDAFFSFHVCSELSTNPKVVEQMSFSFQLGQILLFQDWKIGPTVDGRNPAPEKYPPQD